MDYYQLSNSLTVVVIHIFNLNIKKPQGKCWKFENKVEISPKTYAYLYTTTYNGNSHFFFIILSGLLPSNNVTGINSHNFFEAMQNDTDGDW